MLKVVNYFRERISSEIFDWVLNTSPIFKLLGEHLSKFVSSQNKLLARLNHSSREICSFCNIYMSSLKVIFFVHFFFLESLNKNVLQCHLYCNMSLLNYVPFVPTCLTCRRGYMPYVPMRLTCLRVYMPTCLRAFIFHVVPTCLSVYIYFSCLRAFVPTRAHFLRAHVPTTTRKTYWGSLLFLVLLFFSGLIGLSFHSKPQNKLLFLKLHIPSLFCGVLLSQLVDVQKPIIWGLIEELSKTMDLF